MLLVVNLFPSMQLSHTQTFCSVLQYHSTAMFYIPCPAVAVHWPDVVVVISGAAGVQADWDAIYKSRQSQLVVVGFILHTLPLLLGHTAKLDRYQKKKKSRSTKWISGTVNQKEKSSTQRFTKLPTDSYHPWTFPKPGIWPGGSTGSGCGSHGRWRSSCCVGTGTGLVPPDSAERSPIWERKQKWRIVQRPKAHTASCSSRLSVVTSDEEWFINVIEQTVPTIHLAAFACNDSIMNTRRLVAAHFARDDFYMSCNIPSIYGLALWQHPWLRASELK